MKSQPESIRVGLIQMGCNREAKANLHHALRLAHEAVAQGAQVVCLPELFLGPYFCQREDPTYFSWAEPVPGPTTDAFSTFAARAEVTLLVSLFERRAPGLYHNTVAVVDGNRGYIGKYRKMHIPDDPKYYEKYYFTPGDLGFKAFDTPRGSLGTLICWDQWYPEAARITAMMGADVLFYPTAIGWHPEEKELYGVQQHSAWEVMQRSHAVANGCYVVAVNRTGFEATPGAEGEGEGIQFWGQSFVAAPDGSLLYKAPASAEDVAVVELPLGEIEALRQGWPFFRDRRIEAYAPLTSRFLDVG